MTSKRFAMICLVVGMTMVAAWLFGDEPESRATSRARTPRFALAGSAQGGRRAAFVMLGSGLLAYGVTAVMRSSW